MSFNDLTIGVARNNPLVNNIFTSDVSDTSFGPGSSNIILTESGLDILTENGIDLLTET